MHKYYGLGPSLLLFLLSLALYLSTLAPTVVTIFDDSLELQLALPSLAIIHPTGYPLYSLLGWFATHLIPIGDAAYRANLFSALAASAAVAFFYPVARRLGSAASPAFAAALLLVVHPVWWSQATIAEVYTFQGLLTLLILYTLLRWDEASPTHRDRRLIPIAGALGLGLTHHRLTLLLLPALAVFILWRDPGLLRRPRAWLWPLIALILPLFLYLLLPLRAPIGSLDGSYTRIGFWGWVLGGGYSAFLAQNPFGIERDFGDLLGILLTPFGLLGPLIALLGLPAWRLQPRRFVLLALILLTDLLFASRYLVADIEVFLLPAILAFALFLAVGLTTLWDSLLTYLAAFWRRRHLSPRCTQRRHRAVLSAVALSPYHAALTFVATLLLLLWPLRLAWERLPDQNRRQPSARAWGVHDYGQDILANLTPGARLIGLLGEMTLVEYFQANSAPRPDIVTLAADPDPDRLAAIAAAVNAGHPTYTTRPVPGLAEAFSLSAAGPLIRAWPPRTADIPPPGHPLDVRLTPAVRLIGWDAAFRQPRSGPSLRLNLHWQTDATPPADFKISARLLGPDAALLAQRDDFPVHNTYPPTRWRAGETILDGYDLPLNDIPASPVTLQVILYDPQDGAEIARWQQTGVNVQP